MKCLVDGIGQLPSNLKELKLNLEFNNLGDKNDNVKYLGDSLKQLPSNL